jgi:gliding motility-associated-like protein
MCPIKTCTKIAQQILDMMLKLRLIIISTLFILWGFPVFCQNQVCPVNINFSAGNITNWSAKTGLANGTSSDYPAPNTGRSTIPEYSISTTGIQVLTLPTTDKYGFFPTVPTINGYAYNYAIKIGSEATSWDLGGDRGRGGGNNPGGFQRSVSYTFTVPAGATSVPYTMTYAYALVLENGTHNSNQQPEFTATVKGPDGVITCASPAYYLPTFNDARSGGGGNGGSGTGATLDSATAIANGFSLSPTRFLSHSGNNNTSGTLLQDIWTKPWTEVTFDLAAYRGQQVTFTFEVDNCTPGAHFAYAYIAVRNECGGLKISGFEKPCANTNTTYSIPALDNSTNPSYTWTVPAGWTILSGENTNIITVKPGTAGGIITVQAKSSCTDLKGNLAVTTLPPTVPGDISGDNTVCAEANSTLLTLSGETGNILGWLASTDGQNWFSVNNTSHQYTALNLNTTTKYRALIQNGEACSIDSSGAAIVTVDPRTKGGALAPSDFFICVNQTQRTVVALNESVGDVLNWQYSYNGTNWNDFSPVNTDKLYDAADINRTTYYRSILKSGVCPADTSAIARVQFVNSPFPAASINPDTAYICYGTSVALNATITIGTDYSWIYTAPLTDIEDGIVRSLPYTTHATATPLQNAEYVLSIMNNAGCPNARLDTFRVFVTQPIIVFAGNDTAIVTNQPLQMNITVNDPLANQYTWTPPTGLSSPAIANPVANLASVAGSTITYTVRATTAEGCFGEDDIKVMVFTTAPDIFVPSAFTPNGDGHNDVIKPIPVGIAQLYYFRIYNRWGQQVFNTTNIKEGWDGTINGRLQTTDTYVYTAQGIDYTGKIVTKKGTVTLVR